MSCLANSEAVFGSAARDDADALSDRDILIVDNDANLLRDRAAELTAEGWSVAAYTFAKLDALTAKGALFVQHLKLESRIVRDQDRKLANRLDSFRPKSNYADELSDNRRLANLARSVPKSGRGALFAADILYVAVRNFGVMRLAELGRHTYSFGSVVEGLQTARIIGADAASCLAPLRFLKCLYRSGEAARGEHTFSVVHNAVKNLPSQYFPDSIRLEDPRVIVNEVAPSQTLPPYLLMRDLERRLVALEALNADCLAESELMKLKAWIQNPRAYAPFAATLAPELRHAIQKHFANLIRDAGSKAHAAI